jgi:hypothetical protein
MQNYRNRQVRGTVIDMDLVCCKVCRYPNPQGSRVCVNCGGAVILDTTSEDTTVEERSAVTGVKRDVAKSLGADSEQTKEPLYVDPAQLPGFRPVLTEPDVTNARIRKQLIGALGYFALAACAAWYPLHVIRTALSRGDSGNHPIAMPASVNSPESADQATRDGTTQQATNAAPDPIWKYTVETAANLVQEQFVNNSIVLTPYANSLGFHVQKNSVGNWTVQMTPGGITSKPLDYDVFNSPSHDCSNSDTVGVNLPEGVNLWNDDGSRVARLSYCVDSANGRVEYNNEASRKMSVITPTPPEPGNQMSANRATPTAATRPSATQIYTPETAGQLIVDQINGGKITLTTYAHDLGLSTERYYGMVGLIPPHDPNNGFYLPSHECTDTPILNLIKQNNLKAGKDPLWGVDPIAGESIIFQSSNRFTVIATYCVDLVSGRIDYNNGASSKLTKITLTNLSGRIARDDKTRAYLDPDSVFSELHDGSPTSDAISLVKASYVPRDPGTYSNIQARWFAVKMNTLANDDAVISVRFVESKADPLCEWVVEVKPGIHDHYKLIRANNAASTIFVAKAEQN